MMQRFSLVLLIVLLIISLTTWLTACGFHLKGENKLPPHLQLLHVITNDDNDFNTALIRQLKLSGATIVDDVEAVLLSIQLHILPERTVAKSSSSGLQIEQLKIRIEYSVKNPAGEWLLTQKTLEQTQDFESDIKQLLATNDEKQQLYRQMQQNLLRILMRQLQAL